MTADLSHLNEPRVGRFGGKVLLISYSPRKPLTPEAARNLAKALIVNADSLDQPPAHAGNIATQKRPK